MAAKRTKADEPRAAALAPAEPASPKSTSAGSTSAKPAPTKPASAKPASTNSGSPKSASSKSASSKSASTEPASTEPASAGSASTKSASTEPASAQTGSTKSGSPKSASSKSASAKSASAGSASAGSASAGSASTELAHGEAASSESAPGEAGGVAGGGGAAGDVRAARSRGPRRARRVLAGGAVAVAVALVAGGAVVVAGRGDDRPARPSVPGPVAADAQFALDPAAADDGLVQEAAAIEPAGGTVGAVGGADGGGAEFVVSADGGRTWSAGTARTESGTVPARGDRPRLVAGGAGRWAALGLAADGGRVAWTSEDGRAWTRRALGPGFRASDEVNDLVRTSAGFVAVGAADGRGVVWSSADGRAWRRVDGIRGIIGLYGVAASGGVLVTQGTYPKKVVQRKGRRKVERTVAAQGLWRSADGGRTWNPVHVRQSHGSYGATKGLVAGPGGFYTVRDAKDGKKRFAIVFGSTDGARWSAIGKFGVAGHRGVEAFGGSRAGLVAVVRGKRREVVRSGDGRRWRGDGTVGRAEVAGLTVVDGGRLAIAGRLDGDAYLSGVDLGKVPGAVREQRAVDAVAAAGGRAVAVGGGNGNAAVWSSPDGAAWARAKVPALPGRLTDVAHGARGWLAVGRTGEAALALRSSDGVTWRRAGFPAGVPAAVAAGPAGYVAVGEGAAWISSDLERWRGARLDGAAADVAATANGYVAVGARAKAPAVWTSADGAAWRPVRLPSGLNGPLTGVAAAGGAVVAVGPGVPPLVSADGGATWTPRDIGAVSPTAVTATPDGFVVAGVTKRLDGVVFASPDGGGWRRVPVPGLGGPADRRLTALAPFGGGVLGTGSSDDGAAVTPLLWRADVPGGSPAA
ncbi:beta propeller repeat protein [Actinomadura sediminis]|uniref:Exo-alpha-sialidase n=1 Tax=Actinomadura sediminis TaxID=1038904 RepID=A0ABW3EPI6_9ACTN